jgi:hypothetical protein
LGASHAGAPGDLGITIFSVRPTKDFVSISAGIVLPPGVIDTSYWKMAGDQPAAVQNDTTTTVRTGVTLYYQTSHGVRSYSLTTIDVEGKKTEKLGLAESVHSGIADRNGKRVPPGTVFGVATLGLASGDDDAIAVGSSPECMSDCSSAPLLSLLSSSPMLGSWKTGDVRLAEAQPEDCPSCPTSASTALTDPLNQYFNLVFPNLLTGIGNVARVTVSPSGTNWDGEDVTETVTSGSSSCPAQFPACSGNTVFVIGAGYQPAVHEGNNIVDVGPLLVGTTNEFFDQYSATSNYSLLNYYGGGSSCSQTCSQKYFNACGQQILSHTFTFTYQKSTYENTPVTLVTVSE